MYAFVKYISVENSNHNLKHLQLFPLHIQNTQVSHHRINPSDLYNFQDKQMDKYESVITSYNTFLTQNA